MPGPARALRASLVLALSLSYLSYVFRVFHETFWTTGLGDWLDPYFINYLLDHWYHVLSTFSDPSSPPMFYPAQKTIGYSHSLILYAPFYAPLRLFFHPFQAYSLSLLVLIETGIICLYLVFRRALYLTFVESLLLTTFFFTSANVINATVGVWSQRASVFLVPPIVLVARISYDLRARSARLAIAAVSGFLATLLIPHDFYSGFFAFLFAALFLAAWACVDGRIGVRAVEGLQRLRAAEKAALAVVAATAAWTFYLWTTGGVRMLLAGMRIVSRDWRRPAFVFLASVIAFVWLRGASRVGGDLKATVQKIRSALDPWVCALALGGLAGVAVFFWMYLPAYREHPSFAIQDLLNQIRVRAWSGWIHALPGLNPYETTRSFKLVALAGMLSCIPRLGIDWKTRWYVLWAVAASMIVFLMPVQVDGFSIWLSFFRHVPGFSVIRDPTRIIYLYELAFVLAAALCLTRFRHRPAHRLSVCLLFGYFLVTDHRVDRLDYERPVSAFQQWVEAPIQIDPACRSFYVKGASPEYMSRSPNKWALYGGDSMFIALKHGIPTLNGYSAWEPHGWDLANPQQPSYPQHVREWIQQKKLTDVCELDIEARTMRLRSVN